MEILQFFGVLWAKVKRCGVLVSQESTTSVMPAKRGSEMKRYFYVFLTTLVAGVSHAEEPAGQRHATPVGLRLSPEIKGLLNQEMKEIRKAMESLVFSAASGDWHKIEETGVNIKNSYILKKKLTEDQKHELHRSLPEQFKELGAKFHYYAGMLSHVAKEKDMELVNYYIYRMNEACASCHSKFASSRFPGFTQKNKRDAHDH